MNVIEKSSRRALIQQMSGVISVGLLASIPYFNKVGTAIHELGHVAAARLVGLNLFGRIVDCKISFFNAGGITGCYNSTEIGQLQNKHEANIIFAAGGLVNEALTGYGLLYLGLYSTTRGFTEGNNKKLLTGLEATGFGAALIVSAITNLLSTSKQVMVGGELNITDKTCMLNEMAKMGLAPETIQTIMLAVPAFIGAGALYLTSLATQRGKKHSLKKE